MAKLHHDAPIATSMTFPAEVYRKLFPQEYVQKCMENHVRCDSRAFDAYRPMHVQTNVIHTAASSTLVKIGATSVIAAIKLAVGTPAVATPDQGELAVHVHLTPLCSTTFVIGRQSEESQSLASQLNRILLGSRVVEMSELSIEKGKSAWKLFIDVYGIDHDGNVLDAALVAIMAALRTLQLPAITIAENDHVVSLLPEQDPAAQTPLRLQHTAYTTTFATVYGQTVVDPSAEEETLAENVFSITYTTDGALCGVYKAGGRIVRPEVVQECMAIAKTRATQVHKVVETAIKTN